MVWEWGTTGEIERCDGAAELAGLMDPLRSLDLFQKALGNNGGLISRQETTADELH